MHNWIDVKMCRGKIIHEDLLWIKTNSDGDVINQQAQK